MSTRVLGPLMLAASAGCANAWSTSTLQCTDSACEQGCVEIRSEQGDDQCHPVMQQGGAREFWKVSCNSHQVVQEFGCKSGCTNCARTFTLPVGKCNSFGGGKYTTTKCSQNSAEVVDGNVTVAAEAQRVSIPTKRIASGVGMPVISIGTGGEERSQATVITSSWLSQGGRGVDTAYNYGDQQEVGKAIIKSGVSRKDVFITTKIPGCKDADLYVKKNLKELQVDYIDLLLIHGPSGTASDCASTWKTLEKYHKQGVLRSIGISNFQRKHISSLMKTAKVVPHVNQLQLNVLKHNNDDIAASVERGMMVMAYSPLGRAGHAGDISGHPTIKSIAAAHKVSTYQVAIKWILQKGYLLTFQSTNPSHQASNADVFDFKLGKTEMKQLDALKSAIDVVV